MPATEILLFRDDDGSAPVSDWLWSLRQRDADAFARCLAGLERLAQFGRELRRPHADLLRDGIYELRMRHRRVHYRILYFFYGRDVVVLAHALSKEGAVPSGAIDLALERKSIFEQNPEKHTCQEDLADGKEDPERPGTD